MKWTLEKLQEEANKYLTKGDFWKGNPNAANIALRKKLIDELFKNHQNQGKDARQSQLIWTKEKLQEEANKYITRNDFRKNNASAYHKAHSEKIMNELFKNHPNQGYSNQKPNGYWTLEKLQEEANKYETRGEFWEKNDNAASQAQRKGMMNELFKNHPNQGLSRNPIGYWSKDMLQEEVNKYLTRDEFNKKNKGAYISAYRKKLMDELFKNHPNQGYSDKEEYIENNYVIYVYELSEFNMAYVGLTNNVIRRDREHLFSEKEKMSLFCRENNISLPRYKILDKNLKPSEASKQEIYWEKFYKDNGWKMFNISKPGTLGGPTLKWTKIKLQKEANKYKTRQEFNKGNTGAYHSATRKKIMNELFKNHPNQGYKK